MKDPWGRVESQAWPSDKPVWTRSVYGISALVVCAGLWLQYQTWTPLQRYWLLTYLSARISPPLFRAPVSTYRLMLVLHPDGIRYLPQEDEVEPGSTNTADPHLDHAYAVTSHSSQGQTADRVLIHVDTEESVHLVNGRMAYVAVSRGRYDAQIYTNDKSELAQHLSRDVSHHTAIQPGQEREPDIGPRVGISDVGHKTAHDHGIAPQSQAHSTGEGQGQAVSE